MGRARPSGPIREDIRRYAALGLTELFLEANVMLSDWPVERVLEVMEALAPARVGL